MLRQRDQELDKAELRVVYTQELGNLAEAMRGFQSVIDFLEICEARPLVDPSKRLPMELMSCIFGYAASEMRPSFIAQVSRGWRQIALNTPTMWTTLAGGKWGTMAEFQELSFCMERSKALPLTIKTVYFPPELSVDDEEGSSDSSQGESEEGDGSDEETEIVQSTTAKSALKLPTRKKPTLDIIIPHAFRLRSLTIEIDWDGRSIMESWFEAHPAISTPNLEELFFEDSEIDHESTPIPIPWSFRDALMLRTLDMGLFEFDLGAVGEQLVDLRCMMEDSGFGMLGLCPRLQRLSLNLIQTSFTAEREPIELRFLVDLKLRCVDWDVPVQLFICVHMPLVETLTLEPDLNSDREPHSFGAIPPTILPKLRQISVRVENFIDNEEVEDLESELSTLLRRFPAITQFKIDGSHNNLFSVRMLGHLASADLFPHLECLELSNCGGLKWGAVHRMLRMRGNRAGEGVKTIRRFRMSKCETTSSLWEMSVAKHLVEEFDWLP